MASLFAHELRVRRRFLVAWAIGLGLFGAMYTSFYPSMPEEMRNLDIAQMEIYRSFGVRSMATFEGYVLSTVLNFLPLLVGVFGVVLGLDLLSRPEDDGTLEPVAALPLSRLQILGAKLAAAFVVSLGILVLVGLALVGVFLAVESDLNTDVAAADFFWAIVSHWPLALLFIGVGLLSGAALPTRGLATATSAAVLIATFFGNNLAGVIDALEPVEPLLPFWYFETVVEEAIAGDAAWQELLVLLGAAAVLLVLSAVAFQRRDLMVGLWPWQKPRALPGGTQPVGVPAAIGMPVATGVPAASGGPAPTGTWATTGVPAATAAPALDAPTAGRAASPDAGPAPAGAESPPWTAAQPLRTVWRWGCAGAVLVALLLAAYALMSAGGWGDLQEALGIGPVVADGEIELRTVDVVAPRDGNVAFVATERRRVGAGDVVARLEAGGGAAEESVASAVDGRVADRLVAVGDAVTSGTALVRVTDASSVTVTVHLTEDERDAVARRPDVEVEVDDRTYEAELLSLERRPSTARKRGSDEGRYEAVIRITETSARLEDGDEATVRLERR